MRWQSSPGELIHCLLGSGVELIVISDSVLSLQEIGQYSFPCLVQVHSRDFRGVLMSKWSCSLALRTSRQIDARHAVFQSGVHSSVTNRSTTGRLISILRMMLLSLWMDSSKPHETTYG